MKIGFVLPYASVNYFGGINVQGRMWRDGLESLGHEVFLLNTWDKFDYKSMDYVVILGQGLLVKEMIPLYSQFPSLKIVSAPIIDWHKSFLSFKLRSKYFGWQRGGIVKPLHELYLAKNKISFFLARSEFEKRYIVEGLGVDPEKVSIVPISVRIDNPPIVDVSKKENFCFHVSRLADPGKNVGRLIAAAKKYKFNLKLGGTVNSESLTWLSSQISDAPNIEYVGRLSDEELFKYYQRAKVFALPSFVEGVGMVALESAVYGSEIVLTNIGAPKEYYDGRAVLVNPSDIDSIGKGVLEAMTSKNAQPELRDHILNNYSMQACSKQLENAFISHL